MKKKKRTNKKFQEYLELQEAIENKEKDETNYIFKSGENTNTW